MLYYSESDAQFSEKEPGKLTVLYCLFVFEQDDEQQDITSVNPFICEKTKEAFSKIFRSKEVLDEIINYLNDGCVILLKQVEAVVEE